MKVLNKILTLSFFLLPFAINAQGDHGQTEAQVNEEIDQIWEEFFPSEPEAVTAEDFMALKGRINEEAIGIYGELGVDVSTSRSASATEEYKFMGYSSIGDQYIFRFHPPEGSVHGFDVTSLHPSEGYWLEGYDPNLEPQYQVVRLMLGQEELYVGGLSQYGDDGRLNVDRVQQIMNDRFPEMINKIRSEINLEQPKVPKVRDLTNRDDADHVARIAAKRLRAEGGI